MKQWILAYEGYDPDAEGEARRSAPSATGTSRPTVPHPGVADGTHYPGTYVAGVYNRLATEFAGHVVENESLVNAPNWLPVKVRAEGGSWFDDANTDVVSHQLELDLYRGVLTRCNAFAITPAASCR